MEASQVSEIVDIVGALENKVSKLLHKLEMLKQQNAQLQEQIDALQRANEAAGRTAAEWEEQYNALKMAQSVLGSETNNKEAKLKINALIRELDQCIVQLAE
ncbi:hypothetical protein OZ410_08855 [Robiginitalea sp. M366]|uniref:hypothetical protein n=1 Tax=Robiginitalea aestuariiviva TaxID=3036903 RepID=UPI00240E4946|nr:hypothetical protein [Robiginitalea aestuariiviva]MDG1572424.1 hypothetical protein [Robiginitalea aestuariiviva]